MAVTELICINCPRGCHLTVDEKLNVTGNSLPSRRRLWQARSHQPDPHRHFDGSD
jgi:CxxC motif-containing protein